MHTILPLTFSLGHMSATVRAPLLGALCQAILRDRRQHGADAKLATLGTALGYCQTLLEEGEGGELADLAQAQLGDELRLLQATLQAAWHRPGGPREAAARLLRDLFAGDDAPGSLAAAQAMLTMLAQPELAAAAEQVGCQQYLRWVAEAARRLDQSLHERGAGEQHWRARRALRGADGLVRRLVGYVVAITDPADEQQRARARALLQPLEEALAAQATNGGSAPVYSPSATPPGRGPREPEIGAASTLRIDRIFGWPGS